MEVMNSEKKRSKKGRERLEMRRKKRY